MLWQLTKGSLGENRKARFSTQRVLGDVRASRTPEDTMCGDFCASRGAGKLFKCDLKGDKI